MLLTIQQQYILEVIRKLGHIRRSQLHVLLNRQFQPQGMQVSQAGMDAMLKQLRMGRQGIQVNEDSVGLVGVSSNPRRLEAVDVMLELSDGIPIDFHAELPEPRLLRFALNDGKMRLFTIAVMHPGMLDGIVRQRMERIVWISDNGTLPAGLALPSKHFFAARQADGSHRFYGSEES